MPLFSSYNLIMNNDTSSKRFDPVYTYQSTIYFMAMLFTLPYTFYYMVMGFLIPLYFSLGIILLFGAALMLARLELFTAAVTMGLATFLIDIPGMVYFMGISVGIHHYLLVVNVLISASASIKRNHGLIISFSILIFYVLILVFFGNGNSLYEIPAAHRMVFRELNIIAAFTVLSLSFYRYHLALKDVESELKQYHGRVVHMANTDTLTELPNRRSVEDELSRILLCSSKDGATGVAVALGDLDNFKKVNDTYGHQCGDEVLTEMAARFRSCVRNYDFIGRWGGEEFIFILKNTTAEQAVDTMERIRKQVVSLPIQCSETAIDVTVTFGVSHCREGDTQKSLFERVDALLYRGKESGKNRVMADF